MFRYFYEDIFQLSELYSIQACRDYLPLAGPCKDSQYQSLDRRKLKKTKRSLSQPQLSLSQGTLNIEESLGGEDMEIAIKVPPMQSSEIIPLKLFHSTVLGKCLEILKISKIITRS